MGRFSQDSMIKREKKKSAKKGEEDLKALAATVLLPVAPLAIGAHLLFGKKKKKKKR